MKKSMKTILLTMIVVAVVAPVAIADLLTQVWVEDQATVYTANVYDVEPAKLDFVELSGDYDNPMVVTYEWWQYSLVKFDLSGLDLATLQDPNVTATLYMHLRWMRVEFDWGNIPPIVLQEHFYRMKTDWQGNNVNARYSKVDTQTPWADPNPGTLRDGGMFSWYPDSDMDFDSTAFAVEEEWTDAMGAKRPGWNYFVDVKDVLLSWIDPNHPNYAPNYGMVILAFNDDPNFTGGWADPNYRAVTSVQGNLRSMMGGDFDPNIVYDPILYPDPNTAPVHPTDPNIPVWPGERMRILIETPSDPLPPHAGDVDKDGDVDIFDFMEIQANWQ